MLHLLSKHWLISWMMLCLSWGALAGCTTPAVEMQITESANGTTVEVSNGNTLAVHLAANVTTGHEWQVVQVDEAVLKPEGTPEYVADQPVTTGSGGTSIFRFKAVGAGTTTLELGYFPPDGSMMPVQTFSVQVTVK